MSDYTAKKIDEMEAIIGGGFKRARAELGVESFGMQVIDLPPDAGDRYPNHDHAHDGQEEVYVALRGAGELDIEGERVPLDPSTIVRVGPSTKRQVFAGPEGLRMLVLGGIPGKPYEAAEITKLGSPDPMAG